MDELEWLNTFFERHKSRKALTEKFYKESDFFKRWEGFKVLRDDDDELCVQSPAGTPFEKHAEFCHAWTRFKSKCERMVNDLIPLDPEKPCKVNI